MASWITVRNQIAYDDYFTGYLEHFTADGGEIVRPCLVAWADRYNFMDAMLGSARIMGAAISRFLPEAHPERTWFYATECRLSQIIGAPGEAQTGLVTFTNGPGGVAGTGKVVVDVVYRPVPYFVRDDIDPNKSAHPELDRYVERFEEYAAESVTLPGGTWKVVDDVTDTNRRAINEPMAKVFYTKTVRYVWHQVPAVAEWLPHATLQTNVESAIGTVNEAGWDNGRYALETLLMSGVNLRRTRFPDGELSLQIEYLMAYRPAGWNKIYLKTGPGGTGNPGFYSISSTGLSGGTKPYSTSNFAALFRLT